MAVSDENVPGKASPAGDRYRKLPEPIDLEHTISTKDADPVPDPDLGKDPERDFMLRTTGG